MTIQQFIEKHSLSPVQFGGFRPAVLVDPDADDKDAKRADRFDEEFEFYASPDRTIWVSINRSRNRFRIVFAELLLIYSDWRNAAVNYELEPLITEQLPGM